MDRILQWATDEEAPWECSAPGCGLVIQATQQPDPCDDHPYDEMVRLDA